jgi:uncharacterized surface anchored protein
MKMTSALACGVVLLLVTVGRAQTAAPTPAQTKLTATMTCPKTDPTAQAEVGDTPGHAIALFKIKCSYSAGEIAGVKIQSEEDTFTSEMSGSTARDSGFGVVTLTNNDKAFLRFQGTTTLKNNAPVSGQGTWTFTGGTGKSKAVKGKGTYKGTFKPDGSVTWQIEGDYQLAASGGK